MATTVKVDNELARIIYTIAAAQNTSAGKIIRTAIFTCYSEEEIQSAERLIRLDKKESSHAHS